MNPEPINLRDALPFGIGYWSSAGELFSRIVPIAFGIAGLAIFLYLVIGSVRWMLSGGNKESLAAAQSSIIHAIVGFILLILLILVVNYVLPILGYTARIFE